jgi:NAD-dependent DNA ligase
MPPKKVKAAVPQPNLLEGKTIVFGGTLEMKKADAKKAAEAKGATGKSFHILNQIFNM